MRFIMRKFKYFLLVVVLSFATISNANAKVGDIYINGKIATTNTKNGYILTSQKFNELPKTIIRTTTSWTAKDHPVNFEGVKIKDILHLVNAKGKTLRMHALNDYWVDIPISDVEDFNIILANKMDGKPLEIRNFGPYFVIYPLDSNPTKLNSPIYLSRFIWQVDKITVL